MDNNPEKLEFAVFLEKWGIGVGFGQHFPDRRWENEVKLYWRQGFFVGGVLDGLKDFFIPRAASAWKKKEVAHETTYSWGFLGLYVDIPNVERTSTWLSQ